ncbi:recombinase RecF [Salinivibrio sp. MA440]|uniref:AAA family ATPase n=1 Tax=Salinivibrio sp. MA440 TaxID=1909456 RepID=UPI0009894378|nr:AAA family ATPase [Salinivibrio sp. MA440]OOF02805.1 recombinase RecF [Salinivibrio sp. MA440]
MSKIDTLTIHGFKSICQLEKLRLNDLNVLIGANGVGKSNFVSYFRMLHELVEGRLQVWASKQGGADRVVSYGVKETASLKTDICFSDNGYLADLAPTADDAFTFSREQLYFAGPYHEVTQPDLGSGHKESNLKAEMDSGRSAKVASFFYSAISVWKVFHFHDTSERAAVKRVGAVHDNASLRSDASNLAAYLYKLQRDNQDIYKQICKTVRLAVPFFDDFVLKPTQLASGEEQIRLLWSQCDSDYPLWPSQLSDGSIRFICLVTALLQPNQPSTILIDEPELGLHPYAIMLLGALLRSASKRMQVIVSTQSVPLLNEFELSDLIVVEREEGASTFKRLDAEKFASWLDNYSVGELWEKNIIGGRPSK